jgi:hypothetical protein
MSDEAWLRVLVEAKPAKPGINVDDAGMKNGSFKVHATSVQPGLQWKATGFRVASRGNGEQYAAWQWGLPSPEGFGGEPRGPIPG